MYPYRKTTTEWGRKIRKDETRTKRSASRRAHIAEARDGE